MFARGRAPVDVLTVSRAVLKENPAGGCETGLSGVKVRVKSET